MYKDDYKRLLNAAKEDEKARLIIETICSTGIRVSELRYFTVEALDKQKLQVMNKGKERIIFLPPKLIIKLKKYAKRSKRIVTRAGMGTKIILLGDPQQIDHPLLDEGTNGLSYAVEIMKGSPLCWQVTTSAEECERFALAMDAVKRM